MSDSLDKFILENEILLIRLIKENQYLGNELKQAQIKIDSLERRLHAAEPKWVPTRPRPPIQAFFGAKKSLGPAGKSLPNEKPRWRP